MPFKNQRSFDNPHLWSNFSVALTIAAFRLDGIWPLHSVRNAEFMKMSCVFFREDSIIEAHRARAPMQSRPRGRKESRIAGRCAQGPRAGTGCEWQPAGTLFFATIDDASARHRSWRAGLQEVHALPYSILERHSEERKSPSTGRKTVAMLFIENMARISGSWWSSVMRAHPRRVVSQSAACCRIFWPQQPAGPCQTNATAIAPEDDLPLKL